MSDEPCMCFSCKGPATTRYTFTTCEKCDPYKTAEALRQARKAIAAWRCLARNGVWGTCVDCPDSKGRVWPDRDRDDERPEQCPNFDRYDHRLTQKDLDR